MKPSKLRPDFFQRGGYSPVQYSSSSFIPVYAGAPLEETRRAAEQRAALYHKNLADMTKLDIMNANRRVNEADTEESNKITARLNQQMKAIADKGDYENQTLQVNQLAREYVNDPILKGITESRENAEKAEAFREEMRRKGIPLVLESPASEHKTVTYDENGKPIIKVYRDTAEGRLNYEKIKSDIAGRLQADKYPIPKSELKKFGVDLYGYYTTGNLETLSETKIGQQAANMISAYKDTAEYRQEKAVAMRDLQKQGKTAEEADLISDKAIGEELISQGLLRAYGKTDVDYVRNYMLEAEAAKQAAPPAPPGAHADTIAGANPLVDPLNTMMADTDETTGLVKEIPDAMILTDKATGKKLSLKESMKIYAAASIPKGPNEGLSGESLRRAEALKKKYDIKPATKADYDEANTGLNKLYQGIEQSMDLVKSGKINDPVAAASIQEAVPGYKTMSPERKRAVNYQIQKEVAAHKTNVTTPIRLQPKERVIDEGKMLNYTNNMVNTSGRDIVLQMPVELGGGSYSSKNGWEGAQEELRKRAKDAGMGDDLEFTGVKQGMSVGNPHGIPGGAVTNIIMKDKKTGNQITVPMIAAPNKELGAIMAPINGVWAEANNGKLGKQKSIWWDAYKDNVEVINYATHENGVWESKSLIQLPPTVAKAIGDPDGLVTFEEFENIWYHYPKGNAEQIEYYLNNFIQ